MKCESAMKKEDIKKEAQNRCNKRYSYLYNSAFFDGFMSGAEWRIKSVWHDANEEPDLNKSFVFENKRNKWDFDCFSQQAEWKLYVDANDLVRWAYVKDLKPDMEE